MNRHTRAVALPLKAEVDSSAKSHDDSQSITRAFARIIAIGSIIAASLGLLARLIIANLPNHP
jgi:redox-regulated HSP33 family molecular chaperone